MSPDTDLPAAAPHVLVLGANGRLGRAAVLAFAAVGWRVSAQLRRAPRAALPPGVTVVEADALDLERLRPVAREAQVIVHALNPDYTRWDTLLPPLTEAALALAEAGGATLMLPGNVYNFGRALPPVLREDTPFVGDTPKARQRIALEATLAEAAARRGVRSIVVRAGDFLGDAGTWVDLAIAKDLARGRLTAMGPGDRAHAWAWLPDLAQTFVRVAERRDRLPAHAVLHHAGLTLTGDELLDALETAAREAGLVAPGRTLQRRAFPWWLLRLVAPFAALPRALVEMRYLWQRPHRLDDAALQALIGPPPATPLAEIARACVADLGPSPAVAAPAAAPAAATTNAPTVRSAAAVTPACN